MSLKKILGRLLFVTTVLGASSAHSEVMLKDYIENKKAARSMLEVYISGVGVGLSWGNTLSENSGGKPGFCPPPKLPMTGSTYFNILEEEIKTGLYKPDESVEFILIVGLKRVFPCPWDKYNSNSPK